MSHTAAGLSGWAVVADAPELQHCVVELHAHFLLARLSEGRPAAFAPPVVTASFTGERVAEPTEAVIRVRNGGGGGDGFRVSASETAIEISGGSLRGALNGVYWLLEQLGFLWVKPGDAGTRFVAGRSLAFGEHSDAPTFER
ncbi:MAG TPA: hypothetical protein PJ994_14180, partial [Tepidiformaceae bacterium]|nr:hypothetical protein [Tepidiformaceae bacterium]